MLFHGEKCRHCGGNMSSPKPITEGPKKGGFRTICGKCGHIEYHLADAGSQPTQQQAAPMPYPTESAPKSASWGLVRPKIKRS